MHEDSQPPLLRDDSALRFELRAPRFETTLPPIIDLGNSVVRNFSAEPEPLDSEQTFFKQAGYFPASATADVFAAGTDSQIRRASASLLLASDTSGNRISGSGVPHFCLPQPYCVVPPHSVCAPGLYHSQRLSFDEDLEQIWPVLKKDVKGIANWNNTAILTMAGGGAIAMRQGLDEDVRDYTARHPERWGTATEILGELGNPTVQIPVLVGVYGYSLYHQDQELHDFSGSLISAYTLTGIGTVLIKAIANTDRPTDQWNGGQFGFPSYHAASSFALAGVVDEYYGPYAALPAYALAGAISWSRIDERDHDLSDVFFGAAFGYVIGKAVAGRHLRGDSRVRILPFIQPIDGTRGILLETCF